jgi:ribosomal-protein-alanine N-acetyltransferase
MCVQKGKQMTPALATTRMILKPLQAGDHVQIQRVFPQWEVVKYLNDRVPWPFPDGGVEEHHRDFSLPAIERGEEWHWTLRLLERPEEIIGAIGLFVNTGNNRGFWLGAEWHGRGLMTEAVFAVNDYWFDALGFEVLRAPKAAANVGSRRISEKTGMRMVERGEANYVCGRLPSETWEITRDEWRAWRAKLADSAISG